MRKIEEMALRDLPVKITGNGWNDLDENEVLRKGYILGAKAVLDEIMCACMNGVTAKEKYKYVLDKITELKWN